MSNQVVLISLSKLRILPQIQTREATDQSAIEDYAQAYKSQTESTIPRIPPIIVVADGEEYIVADGFHRVAAIQEISDTIEATVHPLVEGTTEVDLAKHISCVSNYTHGVRLTTGDKIRKVALFLTVPWNANKSDVTIAEELHVNRSHHVPAGRALLQEWQQAESTCSTEQVDSEKASADSGAPNVAPVPALPVGAPKSTCSTEQVDSTKPPEKRKGKDGKERTVPSKKSRKEKPAIEDFVGEAKYPTGKTKTITLPNGHSCMVEVAEEETADSQPSVAPKPAVPVNVPADLFAQSLARMKEEGAYHFDKLMEILQEVENRDSMRTKEHAGALDDSFNLFLERLETCREKYNTVVDVVNVER